ncbi:cytidylate kinase-like family protein [Eubacteriales bacterium OttesenSCG-928-N13]|nr:cytidylate kinase-like family protein [Eubacteriales bacterium OttesenSCG-928-N13]
MNRIITIGREFGSGGRELGRRLAEALHIEYYDKQIIEELAKHTELSKKYFQEVTQGQPHHLFPIRIGRSFHYMKNHPLEQSHAVFQVQSGIMKEMAEKSDCVIIGRCAEFVLEDHAPFRIFTYANMESKVARCKEKGSEHEHFSDKEMQQHIKAVDAQRSKYYALYTSAVWGEKAHYDLLINTSGRSIKDIAKKLADTI